MKSSPLNELTAQDIARKQRKLDRIDKRIERKDDKFKAKVSSGNKGTDMDIELHERSLSGLKERKHKTEHQIKTGERGRPTSLKNEAWLAGTSRKSSSPVNNYKDGYYGVERKSALNMLGVSPLNDMTKQESELTKDQKAIIASHRATESDPTLPNWEKDISDNQILQIDSLKTGKGKYAKMSFKEKYPLQKDIIRKVWHKSTDPDKGETIPSWINK